MGGRIAALVLPEGLLRQHLASGRLRVLATSAATRSAYLPDVPTFVEQGWPSLVMQEWFAFFMPGGTPPAGVDAASQAIQLAAADRAAVLARRGARHRHPGGIMSTPGRRPPEADVLRQAHGLPQDGHAPGLSPQGELRSAQHEGTPVRTVHADAAPHPWDDAAQGWDQHASVIRTWLRGATAAMLDAAHLTPGARVLDIAAGAGDQTLDIAQRIGPGGAVLATDISPRILSLAHDRLRAAGIATAATRVADARTRHCARAGASAHWCSRRRRPTPAW